MATNGRKYPLKQPDNYEPKIPRYWLQLGDRYDHLYTAYIGIQPHESNVGPNSAVHQAHDAITTWLADADTKPNLFEEFVVIRGDVPGSVVWVAYWTDEQVYRDALQSLQLPQVYEGLAGGKHAVGLWCETFATDVNRFETIYSGTDYKPGWAALEGEEQTQHNFTAYWGAMRDRIPNSAFDRFEQPAGEVNGGATTPTPVGLGQRLTGANFDNMAHIRSGQYWEKTDEIEGQAYEKKLEPTLMRGLEHLWNDPKKTGSVGLRFLRNIAPSSASASSRKETCAAGFFRNLADLENWSESHPTHKAIHGGLMRHAVHFGPDRNLRTWHEVSVLKKGEAQMEYINCKLETGAIRFVDMIEEPL